MAGAVLRAFAAWLNALPPKPIIIISHGAFASDQPVLREELAREGVAMRPTVWMDSLHFTRFALRDQRLSSYSLQALVEHLLHEKVVHNALSDCTQLTRVLHASTARVPLSGPAYFMHEDPLLLAPGVGVGTIERLNKMGVPDTTSAMNLYLLRGASIAGDDAGGAIMAYLDKRWHQDDDGACDWLSAAASVPCTA